MRSTCSSSPRTDSCCRAPVLDWPRHGCINVHASLLPRWRGAAPIQRALLAGDGETGITLMQMDAGLDTGPMLEVGRVAIDARETAGSLETKLAALGARMLIDYLRRLAAGEAGASTQQPADGATYAAKIRKEEADIDWSASAAAIDRQVRAFDPTPGAATLWSGERVKIWRARPVTGPTRRPLRRERCSAQTTRGSWWRLRRRRARDRGAAARGRPADECRRLRRRARARSRRAFRRHRAVIDERHGCMTRNG